MEFSVLMPVYEKVKPEELKQSIESLVNQTRKPNEIVIIKDGKLTEELDNLLVQYKEKYRNLFLIHQIPERKGVGYCLRTRCQTL